jgi:hypothetical protein
MLRGVSIGGAAALLVAEAAAAHHSYVAYDLQKQVTVQGTVKQFLWVNPHASVQLMVMGADGKAVEWSIEGGGPGRLSARGWTQDSLKPGDKAEIVLNPRRDGAPFGRMVQASVDGQRLGQQGQGRGPAVRATRPPPTI